MILILVKDVGCIMPMNCILISSAKDRCATCQKSVNC